MSAATARPPLVTALIAGLLLIVSAAIRLLPETGMAPGGLSPAAAPAATLVVMTLGLWATGLLPESVTALGFFTIAMLTGLAPPEVIFSGLTSSAFWLIFSGLVIGVAVRHSGLGAWIAGHLARRVGTSYRGALLGALAFGLVMAFLMPSAMGRIVLILPILAALGEHLGHQPGDRRHAGMMLAGVIGTFLPSFTILPANVPNNIMVGILEAAGAPVPSFSTYLMTNFPVLGLLKTLVLAGVLLVLYGRGPQKPVTRPDRPAPLTRDQRRLALVLLVALGFWMTDALHHISPAWVSMTVAVICLIPRFAFLPPRALQTLNMEPIFYAGGVIGLGALIVHAGLGDWLAGVLLDAVGLQPGDAAGNFLRTGGLATVVALATTLPGVPAILTPLTGDLAAATGLSTPAVLAAQVMGFSTVILPYQAPPLMMAIQIGGLPIRDVAKLCLLTAIVTILVLWPLQVLWLRVIGLI